MSLGRPARQWRLRNLLLAHLLRRGGEAEEEDQEGEEGSGEEEDDKAQKCLSLI